jgi:hypothetical protein
MADNITETKHAKATSGSRTLCEQLERALRLSIPDIQSVHTKDICGFFHPSRNRFAYLYHGTDMDQVKVYFRGDPISRPIDPSGVLKPQDIHIRPEIKKGWQTEFPYFLMLKDETQVKSAAAVLVTSAYPLSIKKRNKRQALLASRALEFTLPEELPESILLEEGSYRLIRVNIYERNQIARAKCIEHYGASCFICGFDFESVYGPIGEGYIHVHHVVPLSQIKKNYKVNPITDLRPVCPNCHAMIHRDTSATSCEYITSLLRK